MTDLLNSKYIVYGLIDPRTNELRYVGKSCSGMHRPRQHSFAFFRKANTHVGHWLNSMFLDGGHKPLILVLRECQSDIEVIAHEIVLIATFRQAGFELTNITPGGESGSTGYRHSDEARAKISEALRNRVWTEQSREKIKMSLAGRKRPPSVNEKNRMWHIGKKASPETKAKMSDSLKKRWRMSDHLEWSAAIKKGRNKA